MPTTPRSVQKLEKKMESNGQRLSPEQIALIDAYIDTAYQLAVKKAMGKWGPKRGPKEKKFIDAEYHRLMNEHAYSLGLRSI